MIGIIKKWAKNMPYLWEKYNNLHNEIFELRREIGELERKLEEKKVKNINLIAIKRRELQAIEGFLLGFKYFNDQIANNETL